VDAAQFGQHLPACVHRIVRVVAEHQPFARRIADLAIQRDHGWFVHHPWCVREFERVPQLVAQHRDADVAGRIEIQGHAYVTVAAGRRQELRRRGGAAEERAPAQVHDQIGRREPLEDGAERWRMVAPAHDRSCERDVVGSQEGRIRGLGGDRNGTVYQQRGRHQPAARERQTRTGERGRCVVGRIHDESPVRPQSGAARRTCGARTTSSWTPVLPVCNLRRASESTGRRPDQKSAAGARTARPSSVQGAHHTEAGRARPAVKRFSACFRGERCARGRHADSQRQQRCTPITRGTRFCARCRSVNDQESALSVSCTSVSLLPARRLPRARSARRV